MTLFDRETQPKQSTSAVTVNSAVAPATVKKQKKRLTPAELVELKARCQCRLCKKYGHWVEDHFPDGKLKPGTASTDEPVDKRKQTHQPTDGTLTFMAKLSRTALDNDLFAGHHGPLLDDGAPFSGIGFTEFKMLQSRILPDWSGTLDALPDIIQKTPYWQ